MLGLKLIHVSKRDPWGMNDNKSSAVSDEKVVKMTTSPLW